MADPMVTQTVPVSTAGQNLGELIERVHRQQTRVIVERDGVPVAALVSPSDLERWTRRDQEREERFQVIDEIRARNVDRAPEEVEEDVAIEIATLRREAQGGR